MVRPQIPLRRPLAWTLDRVVVAYQRWISPLTPPACRFHPSCSAYARDALASHALWRALGLTIWRILRCQPFTKGGLDPVPPGRHSLPGGDAHGDSMVCTDPLTCADRHQGALMAASGSFSSPQADEAHP